MTAPERIWIDAWGGNWSPRAGGTQGIEYVRADLIPPAALAVPEVQALVEAVRDLLIWDHERGRPIPYRHRAALLRALAALRGEGGNG